MSLVSDIKLSKKDASPRLQQLVSEIIDILNAGGYQDKTYTAAPTTSSPGFEGEARNVVTGATMRTYKYASDAWWYSALFTQV